MRQNPFYYGGAIIDKHFCNHLSEIKELKEDIKSGLNILIYAPRRFGKRSFVLKTLDELQNEEKDTKYIFLDIMHISTLEEFINKYFNAIAQSLEQPTDKVIKFFKSVANLRPNIDVAFDHSGNPSFSLALSSENKTQTLEDVLNAPLHHIKEKNIVVVFDEFQAIEKLDIEANLRSIIQLHSNKISYIFMGSKKSILHNMFLDKNRPFYKSVKHFKIQKIEQELMQKEIIDKIGGRYYLQDPLFEYWMKNI